MIRALVLSCLIATPALAQDQGAVRRILTKSCTFTTECIDAEVCNEALFEADLILTGEGDSLDRVFARGTVQTQTGNVDVGGPIIDDTISLQGLGTFPAGHLISVDPAGAARYTLHLPGPISITYLGTCE